MYTLYVPPRCTRSILTPRYNLTFLHSDNGARSTRGLAIGYGSGASACGSTWTPQASDIERNAGRLNWPKLLARFFGILDRGARSSECNLFSSCGESTPLHPCPFDLKSVLFSKTLLHIGTLLTMADPICGRAIVARCWSRQREGWQSETQSLETHESLNSD